MILTLATLCLYYFHYALTSDNQLNLMVENSLFWPHLIWRTSPMWTRTYYLYNYQRTLLSSDTVPIRVQARESVKWFRSIARRTHIMFFIWIYLTANSNWHDCKDTRFHSHQMHSMNHNKYLISPEMMIPRTRPKHKRKTSYHTNCDILRYDNNYYENL